MPNPVRYWINKLWASTNAPRQKHLFDQIHTFCLFIGHGRSGHTALGALLNAHPEMVIGHELDALSYVERGITREELYALILKRDRWFAQRKKLQWHGYDYRVPNQWQGRFERIKVIGDRKAGLASLRLRQEPALLPELRRIAGVPVKLVLLLRNPFDIISTLARQTGRPLNHHLVESHFRMTETNARLASQCGHLELVTVRHEDLIANPKGEIARLVEFLGLEAGEQYLSDCASIVFRSPSKSRQKMPWHRDLIARVHDEIAQHSILQGYSYES